MCALGVLERGLGKEQSEIHMATLNIVSRDFCFFLVYLLHIYRIETVYGILTLCLKTKQTKLRTALFDYAIHNSRA